MAMLMAGCASSPEARPTEPTSKVDAGTTAPSPQPSSTFEGPFGQVGGWVAYNDGTGIWAVDPGKAYPGVFSPSDYPDDAVRLAGPAAGDPIAWSADGSRLLVRPGTPIGRPREALFVLDANGTETRVTDSAGFGGASISPDGTRAVYAAGDHPSRLELATVGDAPPEVLLSSQEGHLNSPAFSPDGGRIAFIDGGGDHSNALWVIDADGTTRRKLAGGDWAHVYHLVWSPDGERLAFSCGCPTGPGVYTIRADGTRLTLVSADEEYTMPVPQWSPDGSQIALVHEDDDVITAGQPTTGRLVVVGAEGGEERQLIRFQLFRMDDLGNVRQLTIAWNPAV
jgi:Tol biopolymer transport system component